MAALGCREGAESPTGPESAPALATTSTPALSFHQVSTGGATCGVTTDNQTYCWGANFYGQVGDGTTNHHRAPVAVGGTLRFRQVSAGSQHTCGVALDRQAYCWGDNLYGQLGDGTTMSCLTPVPVAGGRQFREVDAGHVTTCGVSYPDNRAYCWGVNGVGQLGDGTTTGRLVPRLVAGGHLFRQVRTGFHHTCGVTTSDAVFCWGSNQDGQIGDGSSRSTRRLSPVPVAGGRLFRQVDAGYNHSCAVTTGRPSFLLG